MMGFTGRRTWRSPLLVAIYWAIGGQVHAAGWSLTDAQQAAIERQPLLQTEAAQAAAARERAVSARQLPDPQLKLGVLDLPVETRDAGRFNRDSFTMSSVGLMQEFPLAGMRELKGQLESLKADTADSTVIAMTRAVERDAGLAYLDWLHPHHAIRLVHAQIAEAQRALSAAEIAYRTGQRGQADLLAARAAIALLEDKAADFDQEDAVARENLRRWTGTVPEAEPIEPDHLEVPPLPTLQAELEHHPELLAADRDVDRAVVGKRLAQKAKQPDISVELDYGYRTDYSDLVSLQVGIPLPLFTRNRQDRDVVAAQSDLDAQQATREDLRRRLEAELAGTYHQWEALGTRLDRYDRDVIPPLTGRVDATLAEYRSGSGSFAAVLAARQALLDAQLSLLELHLQRLRAALKLRYFAEGQSHA